MTFLRFQPKYLIAFTLLICIEILIAVYFQHGFVRGFIGDVLVIPTLFYLFKTFINKQNKTLAIAILAVGIGLEVLQFFNITDILNIKNKILRIIIGSTYDTLDILAYILGYLLILLLTKLKPLYKSSSYP